jgi:hypothetical protein
VIAAQHLVVRQHMHNYGRMKFQKVEQSAEIMDEILAYVMSARNRYQFYGFELFFRHRFACEAGA